MSKPPATDARDSGPPTSEGVYTLEGRPTAKLDSARTVLRRVPGARAAYGTYSLASTELRLALRGPLSARRVRHDTDARDRFKRQAVRTIASPLIDASPDARSLRRLFEVRGFDVRIAKRHIYLAPQPGLHALLGGPSACYPADAALAIPIAALSRSESLPPTEDWLEHLLAADTLRAQRPGLRIYDLVFLGTERQVPGYVLQHAGEILDGVGEPALNLDRLNSPPSEMLVEDVVERKAARALQFGRQHAFGTRRNLDQPPLSAGHPGPADSARRWRKISSMLAGSGFEIAERLVLDVGCNAGMMLAAALADGASWGVGWDLPNISERAEALLLALGYSRFDLVGETLGPQYELGPDLPPHVGPLLNDSVVLYLAIRQDVGFVADLGTLPWRALVYEGAETESVMGLERTLGPLRRRTDFTVASAVDFHDGEGLTRPLAVLVR
jgi:hypothetical protein